MILNLINVKKSFLNGAVNILNNINFKIKKGEIISLVGASGSGKSTLLHIAGLISTANEGKIIINEQDCTNLNDHERTLKRKDIGFIYQFHHLLPEFTALENLIIPQIICNITSDIAKNNALEILNKFNLCYLQDKKPGQMSGGENQRIAILRVLVKNPLLILADEPTGNLDNSNAHELFDFIIKNTREKNIATLIVTHNLELAQKTDDIKKIINGVIIEE